MRQAQRYRIAVSLDEAPAYAPMEAVVKKIGAALSVEIWWGHTVHTLRLWSFYRLLFLCIYVLYLNI